MPDRGDRPVHGRALERNREKIAVYRTVRSQNCARGRKTPEVLRRPARRLPKRHSVTAITAGFPSHFRLMFKAAGRCRGAQIQVERAMNTIRSSILLLGAVAGLSGASLVTSTTSAEARFERIKSFASRGAS